MPPNRRIVPPTPSTEATDIGDIINEMVTHRLRQHHDVLEAAMMLCVKLNCGMHVYIHTLRTDIRLDPDLPMGEVVEEWDGNITGMQFAPPT